MECTFISTISTYVQFYDSCILNLNIFIYICIQQHFASKYCIFHSTAALVFLKIYIYI